MHRAYRKKKKTGNKEKKTPYHLSLSSPFLAPPFFRSLLPLSSSVFPSTISYFIFFSSLFFHPLFSFSLLFLCCPSSVVSLFLLISSFSLHFRLLFLPLPPYLLRLFFFFSIFSSPFSLCFLSPFIFILLVPLLLYYFLFLCPSLLFHLIIPPTPFLFSRLPSFCILFYLSSFSFPPIFIPFRYISPRSFSHLIQSLFTFLYTCRNFPTVYPRPFPFFSLSLYPTSSRSQSPFPLSLCSFTLSLIFLLFTLTHILPFIQFSLSSSLLFRTFVSFSYPILLPLLSTYLFLFHSIRVPALSLSIFPFPLVSFFPFVSSSIPHLPYSLPYLPSPHTIIPLLIP